MKRTFKHLVYGLFYLVIFGAIFYGAYSVFFKTAPSCFNGVKDPGEQGIDCGGVCSNFCLPSGLSDIETSGQAQIFHPATSSISVMAEVQNKNADFAVQDLPYKFVFYDNQGNILYERYGNSFVYASEIKYIAEFNLNFSDAYKIITVGFKLGETKWVPKSLFGQPQLAKQSLNTASSSKGLTATGNFINNSTVPVRKVTIFAVFYGKLGQPAGISGSEIDDVAPGQQYPFSVFHPALTNIDTSKTQIYLYGN